MAASLAAAAHAATPAPLLDNTVRAMLWLSGDKGCAAGFVSAQAVALARGSVRAMFLNKLKSASAVLVAAAMLGVGATMLLQAANQAGSAEPASTGPVRLTRSTNTERVESRQFKRKVCYDDCKTDFDVGVSDGRHGRCG